ncbi:hypothetical protein [Nocardioides dongxiaopingii]|uniref:hypothetical protein n=1 Tax=Nocardioides dongxiaopingii TaxID=2576036 RepID=UPI0010C7697C|nr:hypothetical protein [Nocardioides dongxiaopingii]
MCGEVALLKPGSGKVLTEDHAPQRSGASILGDVRLVVLTCDACNGDANFAYEKLAASPTAERIDGDVPGSCPAHGVRVVRASGVLVAQPDEAWALTDLKSAFLIAFATLGYGWARGAQLQPMRIAIQKGELPPTGTCAIVRFNDDLQGDLVLELGSPGGGVAVRSASGVGVVFPGPGQTVAAVPSGVVQLRKYEWPVTAGSHTQLAAARVAGTLFHIDFCSDHRTAAKT